MRRILVALGPLLCSLLGALAPAAARAVVWPVPILDPDAARAIVASGGSVELALLLPASPAQLGLAWTLGRDGADPREAPEWQRPAQQALCPLGVTPLGERLGWVRVRVERSEVLERVLASGLGIAPLAPPEIMVGEGWSAVPFLPGPWDAPAFSCAFAAGQREARWLYGDWDGDGAREVGKYVPALDAFLLDANGNGLWDGAAGGDVAAWVASAAGTGAPLVGDWNGDGVESVGKAVGAVVWLDANESRGWEGVAGGDEVAVFAPGRSLASPHVVGDWDGDGRDQLGRYDPVFGLFLLDANDDGRWDGASAGDRRVDFPSLAFSLPFVEPFVGDFDGEPGDGVGQATLWKVMADLDEDGVFTGSAGGDLDLVIAYPAITACFCGVELPPRPSDPAGSSGLFYPGYGATLQTWRPDAEIERLD